MKKVFNIFILSAIFFTLSNIVNAGVILPTTQNIPPIVNIEYPTSGATISGSVKIKVRSYGLSGSSPTGVQFQIDGKNYLEEITNGSRRDTQIGKCDILCFFIVWDTTKYSNGTHKISIVSRGSDGQTGTAKINVTVNNKSVKKTPTPTPTPTTKPKTSNVGTLSVSAEGNLYIAGLGYYGKNNITIRLNKGTYTLYAKAPSTGKTCWQRKVTISGGKTTTVRISGTNCK